MIKINTPYQISPALFNVLSHPQDTQTHRKTISQIRDNKNITSEQDIKSQKNK